MRGRLLSEDELTLLTANHKHWYPFRYPQTQWYARWRAPRPGWDSDVDMHDTFVTVIRG